MALRFQDNQGLQALDPNQIIELINGNSVVSGVDVSIKSGTLGQSDTVQVASGTVIVGGSEVSVSQQNVQIDSADPDTLRKDIVVIDSGGNAKAVKGSPEDPEPEGDNKFDLYQPAPPDQDNVDEAVVGEVFVPAGNSSITSSELRDRRLFADATFGSLDISGATNFSSNINLADDQLAEFGDLPDFSIYFDSNDDELKVEDEENDTVKQRWDKNGDVFIPNGLLEVTNGLSETRPMASTGEKTITVDASGGADYTSIQEAVNQIPYLLRHKYTINVADGTYNEDVVIPQTVGAHVRQDLQGEYETLNIEGDDTTPSNVKVDSMVVTGFVGGFCRINGIEFIDQNPYTDEKAAFEAYQSEEVHLDSVNIADTGDTEHGVIVYGSNLQADGVDHQQSGDAYRVKHGGKFWEQPASSIPSSGSVGNRAYNIQGGGEAYLQLTKSTLTSSNNKITTSDGIAYDVPNDKIYGVDDFANGLNLGSDIDMNNNKISDLNAIDGGGDRIQFEDNPRIPNTEAFLSQDTGGTSAEIAKINSNNDLIIGDQPNGRNRNIQFSASGNIAFRIDSINNKLKPDNNFNLDANGLDIEDSGTTIWNSSLGEVPDSALGTIDAGTLNIGSELENNSGTLGVNESNIDHDSLNNFVSNEHIDHSSVTVTGTGALTGGGDLTSSRTIDVATNGIGTDELDESAGFDFSSTISFDGGVDGGGSDLIINDNVDMGGNGINNIASDINTFKIIGGGVGPNGGTIIENTGSDGAIGLGIAGTGQRELIILDSSVEPGANNSVTLGSSSKRWSKVNSENLAIHNGGVIEDGSGNTHLTINDGGNTELPRNLNMPGKLNLRDSGNDVASIESFSGDNSLRFITKGTMFFNIDSDDNSTSESILFRKNGTGFGDSTPIAEFKENQVSISQNIQMNDNLIKDISNNTAADSMTADPETATEDGYIEVEIDGTIRQIPFYDS